MPRGRKFLTNDEFIKACEEKHKGRYDYSKTVYSGSLNDIIVICPEHGEFTQQANNHKFGRGCLQCANKSSRGKKITTESFIRKAETIHKNYYSYDRVNYVHSHTPIQIDCPVHGTFFQTPSTHLEGKGCKKCGLQKRPLSEPKRISKNEKMWLDSLGILTEFRQYKIPKAPFIVDGFDPSTNTIYEFLGDYWHGNPFVFDLNETNKHKNVSFRTLYENTVKRKQSLLSMGYVVIEMWEHDWKLLIKRAT